MSNPAPSTDRAKRESSLGSGSDAIAACLCALVSIFYLTLVSHLPISILTTNEYDDAWFVENAERLRAGEWFGEYDHMALIKGPGYSFFLALNDLLGLPSTLSEGLLHMGAFLFFAVTLVWVGMNRWLGVLLFALLLFHPALLPVRAIRDNIYPPLLVIAFSGWVVATERSGARGARLVSALAGSFAGMFWITREEGVFIAPSFALLLVHSLVVRRKEMRALRELGISVAAFLAAAAAPVLATATTNLDRYGVFEVVNTKNPDFVRALNALNSVKVGGEIPHVPVPYEKRAALYGASPTFAELRPFLEGPGRRWAESGCRFYEIGDQRRPACDEYSGGFFLWALREGVQTLGYYADAPTAAGFYARLAGEIERACHDGRLSCSTGPLDYAPGLSRSTLEALPGTLLRAAHLTCCRWGSASDAGPSWPPEQRLREIASFLGQPMIMPVRSPPTLKLAGWYRGAQGRWMEVRCPADPDDPITVDREGSSRPAPELGVPGEARQRFSVSVPDFPECALQFTGPAGESIALADLVRSRTRRVNTRDGVLHLESLTVTGTEPPVGAWSGFRAGLAKVYGSASPVVFLLGLVAFLAMCVSVGLGRSRVGPLAVVTAALWTLYASRLALIALIDVTSFPALNTLYLMPVFPIAWAAAVLGIAVLVGASASPSEPRSAP